jgi:hypothetical protein
MCMISRHTSSRALLIHTVALSYRVSFIADVGELRKLFVDGGD